MGMGMGMTMMPIMSAALATLSHDSVARGSTLMNIIQQSAGSIGTAVMSVILTNQVFDRPAAATYMGVLQGQIPPEQAPPGLATAGPAALADAFGSTFVVALILTALCLIPAFMLPRKAPALPAGVDAASPALPMH